MLSSRAQYPYRGRQSLARRSVSKVWLDCLTDTYQSLKRVHSSNAEPDRIVADNVVRSRTFIVELLHAVSEVVGLDDIF
jgi:hypothetical protein